MGKKGIKLSLMLICISLVMIGCASTKGSYNAVIGPKGADQLEKYCNIELEVDCKKDVSLSQADKERILKLISKTLSSEYPTRFKSVNSETPLPDTIKASVIIRRSAIPGAA